MRTLAVVLGLLSYSAVAVEGQPVTINFEPLGGAAPFGEAFSGVGFGATVELSALYHFGSWSAGIGLHGTGHGDTDVGRDFGISTAFVEARYGEEFSGRSLQSGNRFYPYASLSVGYTENERRISRNIVRTADGPEIRPAIGFQQWFSHDVGIDVSTGVRLAEFHGDFGGSAVLQTGLVIGL